jgi:hypothetical protein
VHTLWESSGQNLPERHSKANLERRRTKLSGLHPAERLRHRRVELGAGAHSILLSDHQAAIEMFRRAGRLYFSVRKPYSLMMFCCSEADLGSVLAAVRLQYRSGGVKVNVGR